ncbi:unnamed protein product, partial [Allacma fusca]
MQKCMDMKKWIDDIDSWKAPTELEQIFPIYQAGYDIYNRPVWVFEFGKFDLKSQFNKGTQGIEDLKKYMYRNTLIMLDVGHRQSARNKGPSINGIAQALTVVDFDKFKVANFIHSSIFSVLQDTFYTHSHLLNAVWSKVLMINLPYPPKLIKAVAVPFLGPLVNKLEVYGRR